MKQDSDASKVHPGMTRYHDLTIIQVCSWAICLGRIPEVFLKGAADFGLLDHKPWTYEPPRKNGLVPPRS